MDDRSRRLCWHGMFLFLLGLITGLFVQLLENPRMGLSAHVEGVMNGILLLALGAVWHRVRLPARAATVALAAALYGTYANWASTLIAAALGTAAMAPLAAGTHKGQPWQELVVTLGFGSVALAMLVASALLVWGLRARATVGEREQGTRA